MSQPLGNPTTTRTPLSADERARAAANFVPYVAEALAAKGRFRVSADSTEQVELFQEVARRAGDALRRPVVSYANGREIVITFGAGAPSVLPSLGIRRGRARRGGDRGGGVKPRVRSEEKASKFSRILWTDSG